MINLQDIAKIRDILRHSITKKLLVFAFSIYLVLTITVTAFQMYYEYQFTEVHTVERLSDLQDMVQTSLVQAIWELNSEQINRILEGMMTYKLIVGLSLQLEDSGIIPEFENIDIGIIKDEAFAKVIPRTIELVNNANGLNQKLGSLTLYSSNAVVFAQVRDSYIILILNAIIKTIGLWVFFLWAGYYYVSKPLLKLINTMKSLSAGDWQAAMELENTNPKHKTEINQLYSAFKDTSLKLFNTQDKLTQAKNRLDLIFDAMPSSLISVDYDFKILGLNKYIVSLSGEQLDKALGQNLQQVFPAFNDYTARIEQSMQENVEHKIDRVSMNLGSDGSSRIFNITTYPITVNNSKELIIRLDDITNQIQNENSLAQVEKLASVGASIAGVAHEINNPLASIMQSCQNIIRRLKPDLPANTKIAEELGLDLHKQQQYLERREITKFLDTVRTAGDRASQIVKNMLKFTRRSTEQMTSHNLVEIIEDSITLARTDLSLQNNCKFKDINLSREFPEESIEILCYPMEISQVILNILKNAVYVLADNTDDRAINIAIHKTSDNKVAITIADNGPGMSKEVKAKIFEPFFTTKPVGDGTGLGMSICKNIIAGRHHGSLEVESEPGHGAKFIIILPIAGIDK